ncbi:(Fe-S)-binding protein [Desulfitobacterium sp. AusDCA]|uniref:(Fe-S)-binding protein n=1 Tax=Desulfitobacterium sp. AusDCA TaxID=3240383 RepID=UPI003DA75932
MRPIWLIIFLIMTGIAVAGFTKALRKRIEIVSLGAKEDRSDNPGKRFLNFLANVPGQKKMINEPYGIVHFFIFWGFIFIVIADIPFLFEGLFPDYSIPFLSTNPFFYLFKDILAILVFIGLIVGLIRRWIIKPPHLYRTREAALVVIFIMALIITEWLVTGAKLVLEPGRTSYALDPAYNAVAGLLSGMTLSGLTTLIDVLWWLHVVVLLVFVVYIPNSKHMHLLVAPFNSYWASLKPIGGQINPINLEDEEITELGVSRIEGFTWKQLADSFACGECGRCMANCPASLSGKPLNPKELISRTLKNHLLEKGSVMLAHGLKSTGEENEEAMAKIAETNPEAAEILNKNLIGDVVSEDVIWSCTTCMSCQVQCPVSNEHVNKIIDMRRYLVMMESKFPPELQTTFRNVENNYNPWGVSFSERANWAADLDIQWISETQDAEYLFWVGCAGSFDARAQKVSAAVAKILKAAGVNFAILGTEEKCCGDFVRRAGNEFMYQAMGAENVELLNSYKVKKIITACPHCLNTLKNEYPEFGGHYEVIHHTQFIQNLVKEGRLVLNKEGQYQPQRIVYHDSCYLGRYQQEFKAPRELFNMIPRVELIEMDRNHNKSFCCGAGGARMWLEENLGERINNLRAKQALDKNPQIIGANCPFCITMLEDGVKELENSESVRVIDPAELIAKLV